MKKYLLVIFLVPFLCKGVSALPLLKSDKNAYQTIVDIDIDQNTPEGSVSGGAIKVDGNSVLSVSCASDGSGGSSDCVVTSGELKATGVSSDGTGKAVCVKADGNLGTCTDAVGAGGTCTCN